jgi:hypothetical protein
MGTLRSSSDCSGLLVNGITLGEPTFTDVVLSLDPDPLLFAWDDPRLPNGVIEDEGTITIDETDDM